MINNEIKNMVKLEKAKKEDLHKFKRDIQESFAVAVKENFGQDADEPIPSDSDIEECFCKEGNEVYNIVSDGRNVGGVIVSINNKTHHNSLELFFICKDDIGNGFGYKAWKAIEEKYPETRVWETVTPYFEKRNIHFYVNKCGFKIVEFYNEHNLDPNMPEGETMPGEEDFFRFEKVMK